LRTYTFTQCIRKCGSRFMLPLSTSLLMPEIINPNGL
jgi:hypothetical protein